MDLYIEIQDGQPVGNPYFGDNLRECFGESIPANYVLFERVAQPRLGPYEVYESLSYEKVGDVYRDVHHVRQMTAQEKEEKQNAVKTQWAESGLASWVFNEANCSFDPPTPCPQDGKMYRWDETSTSWVTLV
jgi:hypothetical protein